MKSSSPTFTFCTVFTYTFLFPTFTFWHKIIITHFHFLNQVGRLQGLVSRPNTPSRLNIRYQVLILQCWQFRWESKTVAILLRDDFRYQVNTNDCENTSYIKAKTDAKMFQQGPHDQELATSPTGLQVALMEGLHHQNITIHFKYTFHGKHICYTFDG